MFTMFMLRDEIPTSSERAAVIAATISGCMPCGLGAGAGTAAGAAAALCVKKGISPRKLEEDVSELQKILKEQGAIIDGTH